MAKQESSKDEQIGFHKGALATLAKEREEMQKILAIVEQLMQMHIKALKELGVDLEKVAKEAAKAAKAQSEKKIEEML
jgi:thiaminase